MTITSKALLNFDQAMAELERVGAAVTRDGLGGLVVKVPGAGIVFFPVPNGDAQHDSTMKIDKFAPADADEAAEDWFIKA